ncbi:MAG: DUF3108 domain-containing protein [Deltaproteobacteria bacterium]|nr:MAG: DUF3108 domain-containing protein [Deltaproteobacteria bacterium]
MPLKSLSKIYLTFVLAVTIGFASPANDLLAAGSKPAFYTGENLKFRLRWGIIPAGEAELEVLPVEIVDDTETYHFVMTVRTNAFIDTFYKYRSRVDAYADLGMKHSIKYRKKVEARKKIEDIVVHFDWEKSEARYYSAKRYAGTFPKTTGDITPISEIRIKEYLIPLLPGSFDPLSIFYYSRVVELDENTLIERPVSDGKKCVVGTAKVKKREKITLPSGTYDTYLIEPDLKHLEGAFKKSNNAKIQLWVTADERRIPVKLKSKVIIGSFTGELISATECKKSNSIQSE